MSDVVIRAENVGKKYLIGHNAGSEAYTALRDVLARTVKGFARSALDMMRGKQLVAGDEIEEFWALQDVSFEINRGDVVGIIGRNGAGKSTLLKILARITEPSTGRVTIKGRVASLLEVGTGFHPELTGRENIFLNGAILGMSRAEIRAKFDEIVAFAEVEKFLDTPVKRYSSGMYVRLAFAVAAHLEPEILIVDEVLAVGDAAFQKKCLGKMSDVAHGGRTVLFVSHNMNAVERLCRHVIHLDRGRMVGMHNNVREGIASYLKGHQAENGTVWRGDKGRYTNSNFVPLELRVESADPNAPQGAAFSNAHDIVVSTICAIEKTDPLLKIGIDVYGETGEIIFRSNTTDLPEESWPKLSPGITGLSVTIPKRLLNEGTYRVELMASLHRRGWILVPGTGPAVTFVIQGGLSDSPFYDQKRPGVLGHVLHWTRL